MLTELGAKLLINNTAKLKVPWQFADGLAEYGVDCASKETCVVDLRDLLCTVDKEWPTQLLEGFIDELDAVFIHSD